MILKDVSLNTPQENILYDELLLDFAEEGKSEEVLRFWESQQYFIVLGRIGKEEDDINIGAAKNDQIPIVRRSSGGGTVLQGPGCLNFSLILSKEKDSALHDIKKSYQVILAPIVSALNKIGMDAVLMLPSDIALKDENKKISGNAQKRGKKFILHHGTILYDFDLPLIEKYLLVPKEVPEYRQSRAHLDFLTNLYISPEQIKDSIQKAFSISQQEDLLSVEEQTSLEERLQGQNIIVSI